MAPSFKILSLLLMALTHPGFAAPDDGVMTRARQSLTRPSQLLFLFRKADSTTEETQLKILEEVLARAKQGGVSSKTDYPSFFRSIAENAALSGKVREAASSALTEVGGEASLATAPATEPAPSVAPADVPPLWTLRDYETSGWSANQRVEEVKKVPGLREEIVSNLFSIYLETGSARLLRKTVELFNEPGFELEPEQRQRLIARLRSQIEAALSEITHAAQAEKIEIWLLALQNQPLDRETVILLAKIEQADATFPRRIEYHRGAEFADVGTRVLFSGYYEEGQFNHNAVTHFLATRSFEELQSFYLTGDPAVSNAALRLLAYSNRGFLQIWNHPRHTDDDQYALLCWLYSNQIGPSARHPNPDGLSGGTLQGKNVNRCCGGGNPAFPTPFQNWRLLLSEEERTQILPFLESDDENLSHVGLRLLSDARLTLNPREQLALMRIAARAQSAELQREAAALLLEPVSRALDLNFGQERLCVDWVLSMAGSFAALGTTPLPPAP